MAELFKKLPAIVAILAIAYLGKVDLDHGLNHATVAVVVTAIAGLGGFYVRDLIGAPPAGPPRS